MSGRNRTSTTGSNGSTSKPRDGAGTLNHETLPEDAPLRWNTFRPESGSRGDTPAPTTTHPKVSLSPPPKKVGAGKLIAPDKPAVSGPSRLNALPRALTPEDIVAVSAVDDVVRPGRSAKNNRLKQHKQRRGSLFFAVSEEEEQLIRGYCQLHNIPMSRFLRAAAFAAMGQVMPRRH